MKPLLYPGCRSAIQRVFQSMNKFLRSCKKYDSQWGLWDSKRKQDLERITDKKPNVVYFDVPRASLD